MFIRLVFLLQASILRFVVMEMRASSVVEDALKDIVVEMLDLS